MARRKEHPEIILIVTAKPKVKAKKGRFGRLKGAKGKVGSGVEGERKEEKRGFFFRKKKAKVSFCCCFCWGATGSFSCMDLLVCTVSD